MAIDTKLGAELRRLLKDKENCFALVEKITDDLCEAPVEQINALLKARGEALEKAVRIDEKLKTLIGDDAYLKSVLDCSCDISSLPDNLKPLFEASLQIRATANRIIRNQDVIRLKIENERDMLLKSIETMNRSSKSVAEHYKRSVETGLTQTLGSKKKKTV